MNEDIFAHNEFIGLVVKIKDCSDPNWIGKTGYVLDETKKTFLIKIDKKEKVIAKNIAKFEFELKNKKITINGSKIEFRPEDRIKKVR